VKYLLVLLVVAFGLWSLFSRLRGPDRGTPGAAPRQSGAAKPVEMVQCAHCGLHLAATDAVAEGSRLYCSDAHRRLGPVSKPPA
jgi:uncharacterized protein